MLVGPGIRSTATIVLVIEHVLIEERLPSSDDTVRGAHRRHEAGGEHVAFSIRFGRTYAYAMNSNPTPANATSITSKGHAAPDESSGTSLPAAMPTAKAVDPLSAQRCADDAARGGIAGLITCRSSPTC
jgi:hypothetical protein